MLGAHPLPGGPLRRLSQPIRERTCCQRPPALWDVNLSAVRRTPITTHTLYVCAATSRSREKSRIPVGSPPQRALPGAGSPADRLVPPPRTASRKSGLGCTAVLSCVRSPAHGDPAPAFLVPHPPAPRPPVPRPHVPHPLCRPAPRASAACRAPCAPCFNKNGVDFPIGGHRIRVCVYFRLLKRFVGRGTAAPPKARWRCTHKQDRNKIETKRVSIKME